MSDAADLIPPDPVLVKINLVEHLAAMLRMMDTLERCVKDVKESRREVKSKWD